MKFQVVEKDGFGVDWAPVRYHAAATKRFETEAEAYKAAIDYLTELNVNNALAAGEKQSAAEAFMVTKKGVILGVLDGKEWFMTFPKDIKKGGDVVHRKGDVITDRQSAMAVGYGMDTKAEVAVRAIPGT